MEIWKDIEGFEGYYQVSNLGRIKSLQRKAWNGHAMHDLPERIIKRQDGKYYQKIRLFGENKKFKKIAIHRLVAMTFIPNPNNLPVVMHLDNDIHNNKVDNLKWGTLSENIQQCVRDGRHKSFPKGTEHPNYKHGQRIR